MSDFTDIREKHPFPWSELVQPTGVMQIIDARGAEVPLFTLIQLMKIVTLSMASRPVKEEQRNET